MTLTKDREPGETRPRPNPGDLRLTIDSLLANLDEMSHEDQLNALQMVQNYNIGLARTNFLTFVRLMAPLIIPNPFEDGNHIELMANELQKVEEATRNGRKKRLQISICPRSMKTIILNLFVAWVLGRNPTFKIMHISHTQKTIEDQSGRPIRDLIQTPEFQAIFPHIQLKRDTRSASRWQTTTGAVYTCFGINQGLAGRGANIVVVDDAMNEKIAASKVEREKINNDYVGGVRSRIWKMGSEVMIGTRWRLDDLLGFTQRLDGTEDRPVAGSNYPWRIISIPAILDAKAAKLLNLPEGGSYWPGTKSMEELLEIQRSNEAVWRALYLQAPSVQDGNIFKAGHFQLWPHTEPPSNIKYILVSMDTAFSTKEAADFSALCVYGLFDRMQTLSNGKEKSVTNLILLEFEQGRWSFPDLCEKCQEINDVFSPDVFVVENRGSGQSLIQELIRRGIPVQGYLPTTDKVSRAWAVVPLHQAKRIWFPKLKYSMELIEDLKQFPQAQHDDSVDAHCLAVGWLRDSYELTHEGYLGEKDVDETEAIGRQRPVSYFAAATGRV